ALLISLILNTAHATSTHLDTWPENLAINRIDESTIYFNEVAPSATDSQPLALPPLKTSLYEIEVLGTLKNPEKGKPPYVLLSAKSCKNCEAWKAIYVIR